MPAENGSPRCVPRRRRQSLGLKLRRHNAEDGLQAVELANLLNKVGLFRRRPKRLHRHGIEHKLMVVRAVRAELQRLRVLLHGYEDNVNWMPSNSMQSEGEHLQIFGCRSIHEEANGAAEYRMPTERLTILLSDMIDNWILRSIPKHVDWQRRTDEELTPICTCSGDCKTASLAPRLNAFM